MGQICTTISNCLDFEQIWRISNKNSQQLEQFQKNSKNLKQIREILTKLARIRAIPRKFDKILHIKIEQTPKISNKFVWFHKVLVFEIGYLWSVELVPEMLSWFDHLIDFHRFTPNKRTFSNQISQINGLIFLLNAKLNRIKTLQIESIRRWNECSHLLNDRLFAHVFEH